MNYSAPVPPPVIDTSKLTAMIAGEISKVAEAAMDKPVEDLSYKERPALAFQACIPPDNRHAESPIGLNPWMPPVTDEPLQIQPYRPIPFALTKKDGALYFDYVDRGIETTVTLRRKLQATFEPKP